MFERTLHSFIQQIRSRPDWIGELWNVFDSSQLCDRLAVIARELNYPFNRDEVLDRIRNRIPEEISSDDINLNEYKEWFPSSIEWNEGRLMVEWCYVGNHRFEWPFFHDTIRHLFSKPIIRLIRFQTSIDVFKQTYIRAGLKPTGFIFHCSRCGSSLLSRMFSSLPQCIVISEALPIDSVLRSQVQSVDVCKEDVSLWLKGLIHHYGRPRGPEERYYFIKFDSWHIPHFSIIHQLFPDTPWLFLYRSPEEVLVSHARMSGYQMVPGLIEPEWYGWKASDITYHPMEDYRARVIGRIFQAAIENYPMGRCRLVNYSQLPDIVYSSLLEWFGVECTKEQIKAMRELTSFNAKNPSFHFEPDSVEKKRAVTPTMKQYIDKWAAPWYERLEELRLSAD